MTPADLATLIHQTATTVFQDRGLDTSVLPAEVVIERPRNPEHGDYATNLALQVAKKVGMNPRELGELLVDALTAQVTIDSAEIAGPGFINIRLAAAAQGQIVAEILAKGEKFGTSDLYNDVAVNLEFVSL